MKRRAEGGRTRARPAGGTSPAPRGARVAATVGLFLHGLLLASWAPRIPEVKAGLGLGDGQLGLALLGPPVGSVLTLWAVGRLVAAVGSRPVVQIFAVAYCLGGLPVAAAGALPALALALAAWGVAASGLGLAVNAQAVEVERRYGRPVMASMHAAWSVGALAGAGCGALAASAQVPLGVQTAALGGAGLLVALPATRAMLPAGPAADADPPAAPAGPRRAGAPPGRGRGPLPALAAICFASFLCEGVAADWGAVYLRDVTGAPDGVNGLGYVAFAATMLAGRLTGDRLLLGGGPVRPVRALTAAAACVVALALATGTTPVGTVTAVIGFAALGFGVACVVPAAVTAAGRAGRPAETANAVAVVVTGGYLGWLAGPAVVGGLAEWTNLRLALGVLVLLLSLVAVLAASLGPAEASAPPTPSGGPDVL